jgi:hypothetical protein
MVKRKLSDILNRAEQPARLQPDEVPVLASSAESPAEPPVQVQPVEPQIESDEEVVEEDLPPMPGRCPRRASLDAGMGRFHVACWQAGSKYQDDLGVCLDWGCCVSCVACGLSLRPTLNTYVDEYCYRLDLFRSFPACWIRSIILMVPLRSRSGTRSPPPSPPVTGPAVFC